MHRKILCFIFTTAAIGILYIVSRIWLSKMYLFGWMGHNWIVPLAIWGAVVFLVAVGRAILAVSITVGHVVGTVAGQFLGDFFLRKSQALIVPNMDPDQIHQLHNHRGFEIWVILVGISIIAGIIAEIAQRKKTDQTCEDSTKRASDRKY